MRTNIPAFRLPASVLDEEIGYIVNMGADLRLNSPIKSMKHLLDKEEFDAVFVGSGAPKGKELELPGRHATDRIHIGITWLESIAFGHIDKVGERVLIIGVGNTAMDCCRSSLRLGANNVKVMARKPRQFFKASEWELEDAEAEKVEIVINHAPKAFVVEGGKLTGMTFEKLEYDIENGEITATRSLGDVFFPCDDVILAIGQENAFPWIEKGIGIELDKWNVPKVNAKTFQSTRPEVFFGGDAAFGPKNIIWSVEHGHQAAISIHKFCHDEPIEERLPRGVSLSSRKMGMHEWAYKNEYNGVERRLVPHVGLVERFKKINIEVELGFTAEEAALEVQRCLNCDVQTVFAAKLCIECDACIDICPVDCLTITAQRSGGGAARTPDGAGHQSDPGAVRVGAVAANRARHGQGRRCLRALRAVRRALSDGCVGHAEVDHSNSARDRRGGSRMPSLIAEASRVNDFVVKFANVNGTGSASANSLIMKAIFRMGVPVTGKNYFPSNIQGLPTWYEIRVTRDGYAARASHVDIMVAMNAETYSKDIRELRSGGYLIYDSTWPRSALLQRGDITVIPVPLAKLVNENFDGVRNRILLKNIAYAGVLAALLDVDLDVISGLLSESYGKKPKLLDSNTKALRLGYDYVKENLTAPLPLRVEHMDKTRGHIMIDGNTAAGLGCVYAGATVGAWYPITPSTSLDGCIQGFLRALPRRSADRREKFRGAAGGR